MKKRISILVIILAIGIIGCKKDSTVDSNSFLVEYSRISQWVDYSYKATIKENGLLLITEQGGLNSFYRESVYILNRNDLVLIKEKLNKVSLIDIQGWWGFGDESKPTCLPYVELRYSLGGKEGLGHFYYPEEHDLPSELYSFLITIQQMVFDYDTYKRE